MTLRKPNFPITGVFIILKECNQLELPQHIHNGRKNKNPLPLPLLKPYPLQDWYRAYLKAPTLEFTKIEPIYQKQDIVSPSLLQKAA